MFHFHSFTFNPFSENTYLIINEDNEAIVVDPGMSSASEIKMFTGFIEQNEIKLVKICNTHAHIDHILGVNALKAKYNIPFGLHEKEKPVLQNAKASAAMFGFDFNDVPEVDFWISEKEFLLFGEKEIKVLFTPGHSPGSISFYFEKENVLISGDVLFNGGIGRTDLPGGNFEQLYQSINTQLYTLPGNTIVFSGHGPQTTIENEMK